ncbi:MAG: small multi-drug export protein [Chloroflexota bacterium]
MEQIFKLLSVIALATIELWAAIPAGLALGLNPFLVGLGAAVGAILGTLIVVLVGEQLRNRLVRRYSSKKEKQQPGLIQRIWQRYGLIGLGLLAPLLTGAPLGAALGLSLGAQAGQLMVWMSLGIVLWAVILTAAGVLGLAGIEKLF